MHSIKHAESVIMKAQKAQGGIWMEAKGDYQDQVHLILHGSPESEAGRLDAWAMDKGKPKGNYWGQVHSDQLALR